MLGIFGLGGGEVIVILVVFLVMFGAKKLPELAKGLGTGIKEFKKATSEVTEEVLLQVFEQLYRHQNGELAGPLKVLQYGDSHTAADEWTGDLRAHFQEMFGDGGATTRGEGRRRCGLLVDRQGERLGGQPQVAAHSAVRHQQTQ